MTDGYGERAPICLHCMNARLADGRCPRCGKTNTDEGRLPHALPLGYLLRTPGGNAYQIGRVLGSGGFGITYLAWDRRRRGPVALKELFPNRLTRTADMSVAAEPEQSAMFQHCKRRFIDEARVISRLRGEAEIIRIYDFFEANATGYYAMEYLHGMDMQRWMEMKKAPLSWNELEDPIRQALRGLQILHSYGMIHRDISPDNLFVCRDGKTKLIDFGSVRSRDADHFTTILKRNYAPPELFYSNGRQGCWTDTFSLCATLYYLLSGTCPAQVYDRAAAISATRRDSLVPLADFRPKAPPHIIDAVMYGMNLEEAKRFRNTAEMERALFPCRRRSRSGQGCLLECTGGVYAGRRYTVQVGEYCSLGRGEGTNTIAYPRNTEAVSRRHCVFYAQGSGMFYVMDRESSFGTLVDRRRIPSLRWIRLRPGQTISAGRETFVYREP